MTGFELTPDQARARASAVWLGALGVRRRRTRRRTLVAWAGVSLLLAAGSLVRSPSVAPAHPLDAWLDAAAPAPADALTTLWPEWIRLSGHALETP
jgi:hypothetical protein